MTPIKNCGNCVNEPCAVWASPCRYCNLLTSNSTSIHSFWKPKTDTTSQLDIHLVYVGGKGQPTALHKTLADAKTEAERLAKLNPNHTVYVVKVVATCTTETVTKWEAKVAQ